ncbi:MAG TPA: threonyl-tRNA synthetase editing domain-containing protein [Solirubrobacterales bacterium]|nr:threonyl-tRNA synthetase editing domain-containing protein [Solirubrobacterales bacterium]
MKLLVWHCSHLSYRDRRPSNRPAGVGQLVADAVEESFVDVLVAFVCVEEGDTGEQTDGAVGEILKLSDQMKRREVVLVPFAHLSSCLMTDSATAQELLRGISSGLDGAGITTALTSFGYHKDFELHFAAKGHAAAVAFRDIPASPRASEPGSLPSTRSGPKAPGIPPPELPAA